MRNEPTVSVGIMDRRSEVTGYLNGIFHIRGFGAISGRFTAKGTEGAIVLADEVDREITRSAMIGLDGDIHSTFTLTKVTIGIGFHWERAEDQTFRGNLILKSREDGMIAAVNEIPVEEYLQSVISSEMSSTAPAEFLKAHAILSRSWLLRTLERKTGTAAPAPAGGIRKEEHELTRWYEQEEHDIFDVCADDHCQRYQGVTKIASEQAAQAVRETRGQVIMHKGAICDARYAKACGGLTEEFRTAWRDEDVPYLRSISDGPVSYDPVRTEEEATRWILSEPQAYCNTKDEAVLTRILPDFDRETTAFFRWVVEYERKELEKILLEKSGLDFGTLNEIKPLDRGPSGRIYRLRITGSKRSIVVGKELEIRRWLSRSHLYSSAFDVKTERNPSGEIERFILRGAGWGHGVGLCQIGAAVMATRGFTAGEILRHYFPGADIGKIYG